MKPTPLFILGGVFAASFFGRAATLAQEASAALKQPPQKAAAEHAPTTPPAATPSTAQHAAPTPAAKPEVPTPAPAVTNIDVSADPTTLLDAIRQRSAQLDAREAAIADRERLLDVVDKRLKDRMTELKTLRDDLDKRLSVAQNAVSSDVTRLSKMFESMKPARAGEIFNAMDPNLAAGFLTQMSPETAALILANMQTEKAYAVSVIIAGRNAAVNKK